MILGMNRFVFKSINNYLFNSLLFKSKSHSLHVKHMFSNRNNNNINNNLNESTHESNDNKTNKTGIYLFVI